MEIFKPFWLRRYPVKTINQRSRFNKIIRKYCDKISKINDENKLIEIAENSIYDEYRQEAEKKIDNQDVLRSLAQKYHDVEAFTKLEDSEDILEEIVLTDNLENTVAYAVKKITNDDFLKDTLNKAVNKKLPCEKEVIENNGYPSIICDIALQITDEDYLYKLASGQVFKTGFYTKERTRIVSKIDDEEKLFLLAKENNPDDISRAAIEKMNNMEHLEWIRDNLDNKGVYPSKGMLAAYRIKHLAK